MAMADAPHTARKPIVTEERYRVVLEIMKKKLMARQSAEFKVARLANGAPRSLFGPFAISFQELRLLETKA